jgi:hypothetical protein
MIPRSAPSGSTEPSGERPIELAMEEALRPGRYISEHASFSVVNEFESVAARGDRGGRSVGRLAIGAAPAPGPYGGGRASCLHHRQVHDDHLSHAGYRTVEAAEALDESYPGQVARFWRALGLGIMNTGRASNTPLRWNTSAERRGASSWPGSRTAGTGSWTRCARTIAARPASSAGSRRSSREWLPSRSQAPRGKARACWAPPE